MERNDEMAASEKGRVSLDGSMQTQGMSIMRLGAGCKEEAMDGDGQE